MIKPKKTVAFVSATYGRDIERFALQRRSIERFAPEIPHRVVVHDEDMRLFEKRFGNARNLELFSTVELLPANLETYRRRRDRVARVKIATQVVKRLPMGHFKGYLAQQLTKYELARRTDVAHVLVIDSDTVLTRQMTAEVLDTLLVREQKSICFSIPASAAATDLDEPWRREWHANALKVIGVRAEPESVEITDALTVPSHASPALLGKMIAHIERLHGMDWRAVLASKFETFSEFMIYEKFCRYVLPAKEVAIECPGEEWSLQLFAGMNQSEIDRMLRENTLSNYYFFLMHSKIKGFNYASTFEMVRKHLEDPQPDRADGLPTAMTTQRQSSTPTESPTSTP